MIMVTLGQPKPKICKSHDMAPANLVWEFGRSDPNPYHAEWQLLLNAIRQDKPHNEARRAGEADVAVLMGRMANHTGQYINWDQALNSDFQFVEGTDNMTSKKTPPQSTPVPTASIQPPSRESRRSVDGEVDNDVTISAS